MARAQKDTFMQDMQARLQRAVGILFVDFTGLTVSEVDGLRRKFREASVDYQVVKNTLMTRVLADKPYAAAAACLRGTPTGVVLGFEDPVTPAKLTYEFAKQCEHLKVKGGVVDNKAISAAETESLSKLPSRAELQAAVVSLAQSPGRLLAAQVKGPSGKLVGAIDALKARLEGGT